MSGAGGGEEGREKAAGEPRGAGSSWSSTESGGEAPVTEPPSPSPPSPPPRSSTHPGPAQSATHHSPNPHPPSSPKSRAHPPGAVTAHPVLLRWSALVLAVGAWESATRARGSVYFPPPGRIARHVHELWFDGPARHLFLSAAAVDDILPSLGRMTAGFVLAAVAGIVLGVVVGRSRRAYALANPVLQFARAVPPPALVPVFVVAFAFGTPMQIASITFSAVWPVLVNTAAGVRNTDPLRLDVAAVLRLNTAERLWFLVLPSALPRIFAGLRLSLSLSLILMVFSELLPGTANGIGFTLTEAQTRSDLLTVWAALVLLGALGYLLNTGLLAVEKRLTGRERAT